jgi:hypothetical protein
MNAGTRQAIAAALGSVPDINGYVRQPNVPKPGDAWPTWGGALRDDESMGYYQTWRITVVCHQGSPDNADAFLDTYGDDLVAALGVIMFVDAFAPARLDTEAGALYALLITGRSE